MSATTLPRPALALVPPLVADDVPPGIRMQAIAGGWPTCGVCRWPIHPAALVAGRKPRHPNCECSVCGAPLVELVPGQPWHEPCVRPAGTAGRLARRERRVRHGR